MHRSMTVSASFGFILAVAVGVNAQQDRPQDEGAKGILNIGQAVKVFHRRRPASHSQAQQQRRTEPKATTADQLQTEGAVRYRVRLVRDGHEQVVPSTYPFLDGDRLRIQFEVNEPTYAYVLLRTDYGGKKGADYDPGLTPYKLLFPPGEPHRVAAGPAELVPDTGYIRLDDRPGIEKFFIVLSPAALDMQKFVAAQHSDSQKPDKAAIADLTRELVQYRQNTLIANAATSTRSGSKGASYEADENSAEYAVTDDPTKPIVAILNLNHSHKQ